MCRLGVDSKWPPSIFPRRNDRAVYPSPSTVDLADGSPFRRINTAAARLQSLHPTPTDVMLQTGIRQLGGQHSMSSSSVNAGRRSPPGSSSAPFSVLEGSRLVKLAGFLSEASGVIQQPTLADRWQAAATAAATTSRGQILRSPTGSRATSGWIVTHFRHRLHIRFRCVHGRFIPREPGYGKDAGLCRVFRPIEPKSKQVRQFRCVMR
uniref:Uncharacterized protein n=1 Tax=Anopheles atroparvus TaxID=41427 RepID=A0A182JKU0_ANOAO